MQVTTIGLDIAKNVFQAHGIDVAEDSQSDGFRCSCSKNRGERNRATDRTLSATVRAGSVIVLLGRAPRDAVTMPKTIAAATNNRDGAKRSFSNALAKNSAHTG